MCGGGCLRIEGEGVAHGDRGPRSGGLCCIAGKALACSLGTQSCQVVGFTSKPEGFDMKRLYRLEDPVESRKGGGGLLCFGDGEEKNAG